MTVAESAAVPRVAQAAAELMVAVVAVVEHEATAAQEESTAVEDIAVVHWVMVARVAKEAAGWAGETEGEEGAAVTVATAEVAG